jgi:hypothetical protein
MIKTGGINLHFLSRRASRNKFLPLGQLSCAGPAGASAGYPYAAILFLLNSVLW